MNQELNALVAEKVMGWSNKTPKGNISDKNWYGNEFGRYGYVTTIRNWRPSSDISDAWKVLEKIEKKFGQVNVKKNFGYRCEILRWVNGKYEIVACAEAPSATRAICLASLKAVGVEVTA